MTKARNSPSEAGETIEVRATRYDLEKVRLGQVLLPIALIAFPVARRFGSPLAVVPAIIPGLAALWTFLSARKSRVTHLVARPGRVKIGSSTVQAGETGRWRWHGAHATVFAPEGNVVLRAKSRADIQALQLALQSALGFPLRFRRRGSPRARVISLLIAAAGLLLLTIGVVEHLVYLAPAIAPVIVGLATFAALSGRIADPASLSRRDG